MDDALGIVDVGVEREGVGRTLPPLTKAMLSALRMVVRRWAITLRRHTTTNGFSVQHVPSRGF